MTYSGVLDATSGFKLWLPTELYALVRIVANASNSKMEYGIGFHPSEEPLEPKRFRSKTGPEAIIQRGFIRYLKDRGWNVERMIGNQLQKGIPDIYIMHPDHGTRWIDLKNPIDYEFTTAQRIKWPIWEAHGTGIWIITGWSDEDYAKLWKPPNWREYWKPRYDEESKELAQSLRELFDEFAEDPLT